MALKIIIVYNIFGDSMFSFIKKNPVALKQEKIAELWNYMTSMSKKDKKLFIQLIEQENEPLKFRPGDEPKSAFLKDKKMIQKSIIQIQEGPRLYDYNCYCFKDDIYEILEESYDQFMGILNQKMF